MECLVLAPDQTTILRKQIYFNESFNECAFNASRETRIITHGWNSDEQSMIYADTPIEYFKLNKYNIIVVNWLNLSANFYPIACKDCVTKVATKITNFIVFAKNYVNLDLSNVTCVGHSLGAHISGFVGRNLNQINSTYVLGNIIALDPAGPLFGNVNQLLSSLLNTDTYQTRVSKNDAKFVTCWHTNNLLFGSNYLPNCHLDVLFDGGSIQNHCIISLKVDCSHGASVQYLTNSLNNSTCYKGYPALMYLLGVRTSLVYLGEPVQNMYSARGVYASSTSLASPYCS